MAAGMMFLVADRNGRVVAARRLHSWGRLERADAHRTVPTSRRRDAAGWLNTSRRRMQKSTDRMRWIASTTC